MTMCVPLATTGPLEHTARCLGCDHSLAGACVASTASAVGVRGVAQVLMGE